MEKENQFVTQYPDLMQGKKIMYNHGFSSSAASGTVKLIRQTFPAPRSWLSTSRFIPRKAWSC